MHRGMHRRPTGVALLGAMLVALCGVPSTAVATPIPARVQAAVRASGIGPSTSVVVFSQARQTVVYRSSPDRLVAPASNMKLATGVAALAALGPDHRFATTLYTRGSIVDGTLNGNLYLVGGGDPTLSTSAFSRLHFTTPSATVEQLAHLLANAGITHVSGKLVVDDSWLDRRRYVGSWQRRFRYDEATALGALTVNQSYPGNHLSGHASRRPAVQAGLRFRTALKKIGIRIDGATVPSTRPDTAVELGHVDSMPLAEIVRFMLTTSDNFTAEIVLKDLGRVAGTAGTTKVGLAAEQAALRQLGVDVSSFHPRDGSGLAYTNRTSTRWLANLINIADQNPVFGSAFDSALAIGGKTGTLKHRFRKRPFRGHVIGKTGTLDVSSALSGWATRADGTRWGFSVVTYDPHGINVIRARRLQNRIGEILVR